MQLFVTYCFRTGAAIPAAATRFFSASCVRVPNHHVQTVKSKNVRPDFAWGKLRRYTINRQPPRPYLWHFRQCQRYGRRPAGFRLVAVRARWKKIRIGKYIKVSVSRDASRPRPCLYVYVARKPGKFRREKIRMMVVTPSGARKHQATAIHRSPEISPEGPKAKAQPQRISSADPKCTP